MELKTSSLYEQKHIAKYLNFCGFSTKNVKNYFSKLTRHVEQKNGNYIPTNFALIFDVCSVNDIHFFSAFAIFPQALKAGYGPVLLSFYPLEDELKRDEDEYIRFIEFLIHLFG